MINKILPTSSFIFSSTLVRCIDEKKTSPFRSNSQIDTFIKTAIYDVMVIVWQFLPFWWVELKIDGHYCICFVNFSSARILRLLPMKSKRQRKSCELSSYGQNVSWSPQTNSMVLFEFQLNSSLRKKKCYIGHVTYNSWYESWWNELLYLFQFPRFLQIQTLERLNQGGN